MGLERASHPVEILRLDAVHECGRASALQRQRVRKMAESWLIERTERPYAELVRFDAIGVTIDATGKLVSIEHLEGAF